MNWSPLVELASHFLAVFAVTMVAVLVLKALYPDLHVWILPIVAGIVWIVYARVVRAFGMVKSG